jgi:hypothetical protein
MSEIAAAIESIKTAAERVGLANLAREAGVPYTTVKSFADRGWSHKNLDAIEKLATAADRLSPPKAA